MSTLDTSNSIYPQEHLRHASFTDVGLRREENQDSFGNLNHHGASIYVVADGMGGMKGGEIASSLAVETYLKELSTKDFVNRETIIEAVKTANNTVYKKSEIDPHLKGMGTTLVSLIFSDENLFIVNVGDSRAYRIRDQKAKSITKDHTLVTELIRTGAISQDQADNHPVSHMLTRSLGPDAELDVDCWIYEYGPAAGDCYLICSDGLYNQVTEDEISDIVSNNSLELAAKELIKKANSMGGPDNITVILVKVDEAFPKVATDFVNLEDEHDEPPTLELEEAFLEEATKHFLNNETQQNESLSASDNIGEEELIETIYRRPSWRDYLKSRDLVLPIVFVAALLGGYLLATTKITVSSKANRQTLDSAVSNNKQSLSNQIADNKISKNELEPQTLAQKREQLTEKLLMIDRSLNALDYATKEEAENFLQIAGQEVSSLKVSLGQISSELDESTRNLARWYGRRKKLESPDALNTAADLADEVPVIGAIKKELDQVTWMYLQSVEKKSLNSTNQPSSSELADKRKELVAGLKAAAINHIDEQIKAVQYKTAELTISRDKSEKDIAALAAEIKFAKIAAGQDVRAKADQKAELAKQRYELETELKEISKLIEAYSSQ
ncbi:MAG: Stp1/IreP family PP2C-type Ser/Thr phosphatase [Bdellovibrionales bacterium]|nr:Stp1/IreP family PP2C-type Ser/Thr phosphatase [Bdellovibrionales bacterium]